MAIYGTVPEGAPSAGRGAVVGSRSRTIRIAGIAMVAMALCAVAMGGVALHRRMVLLGCEEITCMMNSPTTPPGVFTSETRVLSPEEVDQLKSALEVEQNLEAQVSKTPATPVLCASSRVCTSLMRHAPCLVSPHAARERLFLLGAEEEKGRRGRWRRSSGVLHTSDAGTSGTSEERAASLCARADPAARPAGCF